MVVEPMKEVSKNPSRDTLSTTSKKPQSYKNTQSSQSKFVKNDKVQVQDDSDSGCEGGLTFDQIISEKPKPELVAEFIQKYIDKIVREDESETSDFESSEYQTDR
jgi:hypothetical protein